MPKKRDLILDEKDVERCMDNLGLSGYRKKIILRKLKQRKLIPLTYGHEKLPYLLKVLGYLFGDGYLNFIGRRGDGLVWFYSKSPTDLEKIRRDITELGYVPSRVYKREKKSGIEFSFCVNATSLLVLLHALGVPVGEKTLQKYRVPQWIFKCSLEQKKLFLSAFFGAELTKPKPRKSRPTLFANPQLEIAKDISIEESAKEFLEDIAKLLRDFKIESAIYKRGRTYTRKKDNTKTIRYILSIKSTPENLIRLWSKIGYEYNRERQELAKYAVAYIKYKMNLLERRRKIAEEVKKLITLGLRLAQIKKVLGIRKEDARFVEEIYRRVKRNKKIPEIRLPRKIMSFKEFIKQHSQSNNCS